MESAIDGYPGHSLADPAFRDATEIAVLDGATGGIASRELAGDMELMITALRGALSGLGG